MSTLRSAVLSVVALTLSVLASVLVSGAPAQATTPAGYGAAAVRATNVVRGAHHLPHLRGDACLHRYASAQAARMARQHRMFHQDIVATLRGCHLHSVGENVAVGYRSGTGVVRRGWMRSAPHRANILRRPYRLIAVAARKGSDGLWYASQVFGRR